LPTPLSTLTAKIQEAFQAHPEKKWVKASIDTLHMVLKYQLFRNSPVDEIAGGW
jgi:hypothetical protein